MHGEIRNHEYFERTLTETPLEMNKVIYFAGIKAIGESAEKSLHQSNMSAKGNLCLLEAMKSRHCHSFVLKSSATIY